MLVRIGSRSTMALHVNTPHGSAPSDLSFDQLRMRFQGHGVSVGAVVLLACAQPRRRFQMRQNPGAPTDVISLEQGLSEFLIGASVAGLAFFTMLVAFFWF